MQTAYKAITANNLILRDTLAIERTSLANERTFYSAVRTALTFFIAGVTVIKFVDHPYLIISGWVFLVFSFLFFVFGIHKHFINNKNIHASYYYSTEEVQVLFQENRLFSPSLQPVEQKEIKV